MQTAIWSFIAGLAGGDAAPCRCAVSVALALDGNAVATGQGGTSGRPAGVDIGGSTGSALSVSVSGDGPASANAASGNVGGSATGVGPTVTPIVLSPSEDASTIASDVRALVSGLLTANSGAATLEPSAAATLTAGWQGPVHAAVTAQLAFAAPGAPEASLAECTRAPRCVIAISVAAGGSARAVVSPGSAETNECAATTTSLAGPAAAIAISGVGDAQASAKRGNDASVCATTDAGNPAVSSGATGTSVGIALTGKGTAAATSSSGNSGRPTRNGASTAAGQADSQTGRTGDAVGVAIAKIGAIAVVRSGDSGSSMATCVGCTMTTVPAGGTAIATATSGNTGSSYAVAVAGLAATVTAQSGDTGPATALTGIDSSFAPASGQGAVTIGRSGETGDVLAVAVSLDSSVTITTQSGGSGAVVSTALQGAICASPSADAVITCTTPTPPDGGPTSTVQQSSNGSLIIKIGNSQREASVPPMPGMISVTRPAAVTVPALIAGTDPQISGPTYREITNVAHVQRRSAQPALARANNQSVLIAPIAFGSGLVVLAFVLIVAGFTRRRRSRYMRRN